MPDGADAYLGLVREQLDEERATKASLEQRALAVITTSSTLVTLLFGLAAFVLAKDDQVIVPPCGQALLIVALALFVAAAVLGILVNVPKQNYHEAKHEGLQALVDEEARWSEDWQAGSRNVAATWVNVIKAARQMNGKKANLLIAAMACEVGAVLLVAVAVISVFAT